MIRRTTEPDDSPGPALITPRRLAGQVEALAVDLGRIRHRVARLGAYVDHPGFARVAEALAAAGGQLDELAGKALVGQLPITAGRDDEAGRERYPLFEGRDSGPPPSGSRTANGQLPAAGKGPTMPQDGPGSPPTPQRPSGRPRRRHGAAQASQGGPPAVPLRLFDVFSREPGTGAVGELLGQVRARSKARAVTEAKRRWPDRGKVGTHVQSASRGGTSSEAHP